MKVGTTGTTVLGLGAGLTILAVGDFVLNQYFWTSVVLLACVVAGDLLLRRARQAAQKRKEQQGPKRARRER